LESNIIGMKDFLSKKNNLIQPFHVMDILAQAQKLEKEGKPIIHLEVGEPDFSTPKPIIDAAISAMQSGQTRYTSALGLIELREKISQHYATRYGVQISPIRIIITPGASGALLLVLSVLLDSGDLVAVTDPGYPCNSNIVKLLNAQINTIPLSAENDFVVSKENIERYWQEGTKVLMLASPSNPTGRIVSKKELIRIQEFVQSKNAVLLMDEIYQGLIYNEDAVINAGFTSLEISKNLCVINSFSKYFCMTGWRLGWAVVPEAWLGSVDKVAQNIYLSPPTVSQYAAIAAFERESIRQLELYRADFQSRRDYLYSAVKELGFKLNVKPEGAFYLYANSASLHARSDVLVSKILDQVGVALTPGKDFGLANPQDYVRFSYTVEMDKLKHAVSALKKYFK